jgi:hypothetical protein
MDQIMLRDGNGLENFGTAIRGEMTRTAHGGTVQISLGSAMGKGAFRGAWKLLSGLVAGTIVIALATIVAALQPAQALPSFAQQTGQPCGTCHTDIPGLTPYGRLFKIKGYTTGGGPYRTTPFPTADNSGQSEDKRWVPPVSMMAIGGFTNTQASLPPPTAPYSNKQQFCGVALELFLGWGHHRSSWCFRAGDL